MDNNINIFHFIQNIKYFILGITYTNANKRFAKLYIKLKTIVV